MSACWSVLMSVRFVTPSCLQHCPALAVLSHLLTCSFLRCHHQWNETVEGDQEARLGQLEHLDLQVRGRNLLNLLPHPGNLGGGEDGRDRHQGYPHSQSTKQHRTELAKID